MKVNGVSVKAKLTNRDPRVGFALTSSFSATGLWMSDSSSLRSFLRLSFMVLFEIEEEGRFPLRFEEEDGYACSVGGVPIVSEPWEEGEE